MKTKIKPLIDNKAPKLDVDKILKSKKLILDFARLKQIYRDNMILLRKINIIQHTTGRTDNYNPLCGKRITKLDPVHLNHRLKKIEKDNLHLLKRINAIRPTISKSNHDKHWEKASEEIARKSKYPICLPGFESTSTEMVEKSKSLTTFLALSRPRVFIEFTGEECVIGHIICALFYDSVPDVCKMFYERCQPHKNKCKSFNYTGTSVGRIFPGLFCEMGHWNTSHEFQKRGEGVRENDQKCCDESNISLDCRYRGTLAIMKNVMCNNKNTEFYITFKPLPVMNHKYEVCLLNNSNYYNFKKIIGFKISIADFQH